jgi:hypothetical protein
METFLNHFNFKFLIFAWFLILRFGEKCLQLSHHSNPMPKFSQTPSTLQMWKASYSICTNHLHCFDLCKWLCCEIFVIILVLSQDFYKPLFTSQVHIAKFWPWKIDEESTQLKVKVDWYYFCWWTMNTKIKALVHQEWNKLPTYAWNYSNKISFPSTAIEGETFKFWELHLYRSSMNVFMQLWQQNLCLQINIFFVCVFTLKDHNEHAPHIYTPLKL